jgi:hypothetical protein
MAKFADIGQNGPMLVSRSDMSVATLLMLLVFGAVVAAASWVYRDAREQAATGNPVVYSTGTLHITTPAAWFLACTLLFEFFLPTYLDSRRFA